MDRNEVALSYLKAVKPAFASGDYATAIEGARKALDENPGWPVMGHALQIMATSLSESGRPEESLSYWEAFFNGVPKEYPTAALGLAYYNRAYAYRVMRDHKLAGEDYAKALPLFMSVGQYVVKCLHNLAWNACLNGDVAEARSHMLEALKSELNFDGEDVSNHMITQAFVYALEGDMQSATGVCNTLLKEKESANIKAHACWLLGDIALNNGSVTEAAEWSKQAEVHASNDPCKARLMVDINSLRTAISKAS